MWQPETRERQMIDCLRIRASTPGDLAAIEALYADAFPQEDLLPLVQDLLKHEDDVLSLIGTVSASLIAHVMFTKGGVGGNRLHVALLGPLAVAPVWQRKGAGSLIVRDGLQRLRHDGIGHVFVLGDPEYYGRFGFTPETNVAPPYPLPAQWKGAWQSMHLGDAAAISPGTLQLPELWRHKKYWTL